MRRLEYNNTLKLIFLPFLIVSELFIGGTIEDSRVLAGVMFNKDVTHPKMRRRIENPKILLLDCNLEYKKGESQTNIEIMKEEDFTKILEMEESYIKKICEDIVKFSPDLVNSFVVCFV